MSSVLRRADIAHARRFVEASERWAEAITTPRVLDAIGWFDNEIGNLALAFQRVNDPLDLHQPELVRDFALALFPYFERVSMWTKWDNEFGAAGVIATRSLPDERSRTHYLPRLLNATGITRRMQGQAHLIEAITLFEEARDTTTEDGIRSDAWVNLADIHRLQGETVLAIAAAQQAIRYGELLGDLTRQAKGWEYLGLAWLPEDNDEAIHCYETAVDMRQRSGNIARLAQVLTMLAYGLTQRGEPGDLQRALAAYEQSAEFDKQIHNWQALGRYWGDIAETYNRLGMYQEAIDNSMYALDRNLQIGYRRGEGLNYIRLAESYLMLGQHKQALRYAELACDTIEALSSFDKRLALARFQQVILELSPHCEPTYLHHVLIDRLLRDIGKGTSRVPTPRTAL